MGKYVCGYNLLEDPGYKLFLDKCKEFRKKYNISQDEISEAYHINQGYISGFERGLQRSAPIMWIYIEMMGGDLTWLKKE